MSSEPIVIDKIDDEDVDSGDEEAPKEEDKQVRKSEERDVWGSKVSYILTLIGFTVGFGNIWRFPYQLRENGGLVFLIPYFIGLFVLGIPLFFMELAVGQRRRKGMVYAWAEVSPVFGGIGMSAGIICFMVGLYFNTLIAYCLNYLVDSCFPKLPWASCENTYVSAWQKPDAQEQLDAQKECETKTGGRAAKYYWYRGVLDISKQYDELGNYSWRLFAFITISWLITYLILIKGTKTMGNVVYVTAVFPYIVLVIFFINNFCQEPGKAWLGAYRLLKPDWTKLYNPVTWLKACSQIFFSLGLAHGCLVVFASYNTPRNNCHQDAIAIGLINSASSMFASLVVFPIIGLLGHRKYDECMDLMQTVYPGQAYKLGSWHDKKYDVYVHSEANTWMDLVISPGINKLTFFAMLEELDLNGKQGAINDGLSDSEDSFTISSMADIDQVYHPMHVFKRDCSIGMEATASGGGTGFVFMAFTEAVLHMPVPQVWAVLFFFMLVFLGIDSGFGTVEASLDAMQDLIRIKKRWVATSVICGISWVLCLVLFPFGMGTFVLDLLDQWTINWTLLLLAVLECIAVAWCYGLARFSYDIHLMTGSKPNKYMLLCWKWITPGIASIMLVASIVRFIVDTAMSGGIFYVTFDPTDPNSLDGDVKKKMPAISLTIGFSLMIICVLPVPLHCCFRRSKLSLLKAEAPAEFPEEELREERQIDVEQEADQFTETEQKIMGERSIHDLQEYRDTQGTKGLNRTTSGHSIGTIKVKNKNK